MSLNVFLVIYALGIFSLTTNSVKGHLTNNFYTNSSPRNENSECEISDGVHGICKRFADCPINRIRHSRWCSFVNNTVIYCCPNELISNVDSLVQVDSTPSHNLSYMLSNSSTNTLPNTLANTSNTSNGLINNFPNTLENAFSNTLPKDEKSNIKRSAYKSYSSTNTSPKHEKLNIKRSAEKYCEFKYPEVDPYTATRFLGGVLSLPDQHPHMAAIGWTMADGTVDWACGGAVISTNFIITTAGCTAASRGRPDVARTRDLNLLIDEEGVYPQNYKITDTFVHPDYVRSEIYHDIGLLKFEGPRNPPPWPACLWTRREIPTKDLLAMGYGARQFAGPRSNVLYEGNLRIVPNDECSIKFHVRSDIPKGIIPQQLCAQDPEHNKDTCQGDSGGPLQFYVGEGLNRKTMIAGITSFGQDCGGAIPGVYTRISEYIDWIESIVWPGGFKEI